MAISNGTDTSSGASFTYTYVGTGTTVYGPSTTKPTHAGTYKVVAALVSDTHSGSGEDAFTISKKALIDDMITAIAPASNTYTGSSIRPTPTVVDANGPITSSDYAVSWQSNINAGSSAKVVITATEEGNYSGSAMYSFTIAKADQAALTLNLGTALLLGNSLTASATGGSGDGAVTFAITSGGSYATLTDASLTGTAPGTVTVTATKAANANYNVATSPAVTVTVSDKMTIAAAGINTADITDTAITALLKNEGKYTVGAATRKSVNLNEFTVAVTGTAALESYASSNAAQGSGKWIGIISSYFT